MAKPVLAYILIDIELGYTDAVVEELRKIDEATRIAVTTGAYDVVVLLEVDNLEALYAVTVRRIHQIKGIKETTTAVVEMMISV